MPAEDVALALMMLDDESVRSEVSRWDFSRFERFELEEEERRLLVNATRGVVTIDEETPVPLRSGNQSVVELSGEGGPGRGFYYWPPGVAQAIKYLQTNLTDPRLQASLIAWQESRGDRFP